MYGTEGNYFIEIHIKIMHSQPGHSTSIPTADRPTEMDEKTDYRLLLRRLYKHREVVISFEIQIEISG